MKVLSATTIEDVRHIAIERSYLFGLIKTNDTYYADLYGKGFACWKINDTFVPDGLSIELDDLYNQHQLNEQQDVKQ